MSKPVPDAQQPVSAETAADGTATAAEPLYYGTPAFLHYGCVATAVLSPIALALPPRRFNIRSLFLTAATFGSTSMVVYDYTGKSIYQRYQSRLNQYVQNTTELPEGARLRQAAMNAERERRKREAEAAAAAKTAEESKLHKIWMGKENENWVQERTKHEKEMIDSGAGIWGLITEQISEVASDLFGKKPSPEDESKSEKPDDKPSS